MLEIKVKNNNNNNSLIDMKDTFDGLISSLDIAKERISELEDMAIGFSKTQKQREQRLKSRTEYTSTVG